MVGNPWLNSRSWQRYVFYSIHGKWATLFTAFTVQIYTLRCIILTQICLTNVQQREKKRKSTFLVYENKDRTDRLYLRDFHSRNGCSPRGTWVSGETGVLVHSIRDDATMLKFETMRTTSLRRFITNRSDTNSVTHQIFILMPFRVAPVLEKESLRVLLTLAISKPSLSLGPRY